MKSEKNFSKVSTYLILFVLGVASISILSLSTKVDQTSINQKTNAQVNTVSPTPGLAHLPSELPNTFGFGLFNGTFSDVHASVPYTYRYQYLAGGVHNGDGGWWNWGNGNGSYITSYIADSRSRNMKTPFVYYQILQSGTSNDEYRNLNNASLMYDYYQDFKRLMQKINETGDRGNIVIFEPDLEGVMQQEAHNINDNAGNQPTKVRSSLFPDVANYPDDYAAFHRAIAHIRDLYAPHVLLALDISLWGPNDDLITSLRDQPTYNWQNHANRIANYFNSFGNGFDMVSFSPIDRDAACYSFANCPYDTYSPNPPTPTPQGYNRWWWDDDSREPKFSTVATWLSSISSQTNKRVIMWQVPNGNRLYRTENNTAGHYQDNKTEYFLNPTTGRSHIQTWIDAGVVGLMWGAGVGSQSHYFDSNGDGVTNPSALSPPGNPQGIPNTLTSTVSDDDGGYIADRVASYYTTGTISLPPGRPAVLPPETLCAADVCGGPTTTPGPGGNPPSHGTPNGVVDVSDFNCVRAEFGKVCTQSTPCFYNIVSSTPERVDILDFNLLRQATGRSCQPTPTLFPIPTSTPTPIPPTGYWLGTYYNDTELTDPPVLTRNDTNLTFNWGLGSPAPGINTDQFSVRWIKQVNFTAGTYRFTTAHDDGVRVYVDDQPVTDYWYWGSRTDNDSTHITGGNHVVKVEFFDGNQEASINVSWTRTGN